MLKRRLTRLLALMVLTVPTLAACGAGDATPTTAPAAATATSAPATGAEATATTAPVAEATAEATVEATVEPAATDGNILRVHQVAYPDVFDPQKSSYSAEIVLLSQNYEGLTRLNDKLETVPGAAEKWEANADGTVFTFTLRPDLKYSDGSPLTSKNFAYSIQRTCDPVTAGEYQSILFDITGCADFAGTAITDTAKYDAAKAALGVSTPDDKTIVISTVQAAPYLPTIAGLWVMYPAKQELIEKGGENWWKDPAAQVGNGPFQFSRIAEDQQIDFVRNENYWNKAKLDGISMIYIDDSSVALEAYRTGQLDIFTPDPSQIPAVQSDADLGPLYISYPGANTTGLQFNTTMEPFNDLKVREAFAYAIDRDTFCEVIRNGDCLPTLTWIPQGIPGYDATEDRFAFDPEKAKAALAESSYGSAEKLPEITMAYSSNDTANQARHEFLANTFREVLGVEVKLLPLPSKDLTAAKKDNSTYPQLSLGGWIQDYPDAQNWLSVFWNSNATFAQRQGYGNPAVDEFLTKADTSTDDATRLEAYGAAQKLIVGDLPTAMMYNRVNKYVINPRVSGFSKTAADDQFPGQWTSYSIEIK
ncbi:peptide ABC transporter substrate-binding protein [Herpetosiphon geysericola]|uniref:4-phytase n=1 Tax=Herpetosiphon geysericola TaxID=70996 RepID=A0A0P6Y3C6_9CHLR|nr:peptide ABC transporter substrate-binding protein [Herpetosiphon geysericola]KPL90391.1 4-phytase [Herpetosiphon geysericola]